MASQRVDITGTILALYPMAVVERRQFDGGINYRVTNIPGVRPVSLSVEWGDDEQVAADTIVQRIVEQDPGDDD